MRDPLIIKLIVQQVQYVGPGATCPTLALSHTSRAWLQSVVSFVELYNTNTGTTHPLTNAPVRRTPPGGYGQQRRARALSPRLPASAPVSFNNQMNKY